MKSLNAVLLLAVLGPFAAAQAVSAPPAAPTVKAILVLEGALSSKTAAGKEFKLLLDRPVKLPGGRLLPRETVFHGVVAQSAAHSKKLPNGALILKIDEALPKNEAPIPLAVTIEDVGRSFDDDDAPPPAKKDDKKKDEASTATKDAPATSAATEKTPQFKKTQLDGVFLALSPQGSAILVAPGAELFLDNPTAMSVSIAEPQPQNP